MKASNKSTARFKLILRNIISPATTNSRTEPNSSQPYHAISVCPIVKKQFASTEPFHPLIEFSMKALELNARFKRFGVSYNPETALCITWTEPIMILVTGATGFVGTGLVGELSNRQLAHRPISRNRKDGFYAIGNIDGTTDWSDALAGITTVVHLAARVHVMKESATDPLLAFRSANVDATLNLAGQSAEAGVRRFIFLSSIKVNGETTDNRLPFTADDIADPHDPYGQSKHEAEQALLTLARTSDMKVTIIRPPLIYGPGVKANFAALLKLAHSRLPLPIGGIDNKRSLVFLGNLIDFIICCIDSEKAANQIFLVSDNEDVSTSELVRRLGHEMNVTPRLISVPRTLIETLAKLAGKGPVTSRLFGSLQLDIRKSCELLDWSPSYSLSEGLRITVAADPKA